MQVLLNTEDKAIEMIDGLAVATSTPTLFTDRATVESIQQTAIDDLSGFKLASLLPNDEQVAQWFDENIDKGCSASSAIYKFRLWLSNYYKVNQH